MIKKKVLDTFSLLWKIAIPLISAVIGLKLVEQFNVLQALSIITDEDRAFDICTSVYFAIINVMLLSAAEWIKNTFFPAQSIQVIFSKPGDIVQNNAMPDLLLREASPCEARVTVMINARACLKIGDVSSSEGFWAAGKQFFRRNPGGFQGKIAPSRGQKPR